MKLADKHLDAAGRIVRTVSNRELRYLGLGGCRFHNPEGPKGPIIRPWGFGIIKTT